jgi:hypothetical protein
MLNPVESDMRAFRAMSVDAPVSKRERSTVAGRRVCTKALTRQSSVFDEVTSSPQLQTD